MASSLSTGTGAMLLTISFSISNEFLPSVVIWYFSKVLETPELIIPPKKVIIFDVVLTAERDVLVALAAPPLVLT